MLGTLLNAGAVLLGALLGLLTKGNLSAARQQQIKLLLGLAAVWFGLRLFWKGLALGSVALFFTQLIVVVVAMVLGHLVGKLCGIQTAMNQLGQSAKTKLEAVAAKHSHAPSDGFMAATILFCAAPLGMVGALEDGLAGYFAPLAIKAAMDGLAAFSFARMFGWTAALSAIPVAALLSGFTLLGERLEPLLRQHDVLGVVHASSGLIITYVALVIFEVKKVEIANYLPALVVAPLLMKLVNLL